MISFSQSLKEGNTISEPQKREDLDGFIVDLDSVKRQMDLFELETELARYNRDDRLSQFKERKMVPCTRVRSQSTLEQLVWKPKR